MLNINCLPPEILLYIFRLYLQTETQHDFMHCIGKVCRNWHELCKDPSLWQEFDGTLPFEVLKQYCDEGILNECKIIVFSNVENGNVSIPKEIRKMYENLPKLNCVNFSNVMGLRSKQFFVQLASKCPEVQEIIFNDKLHNYKICPWIIGLFKDFLRVRGTNLVSLVFSNLYLRSSIDLFSTIGNSCPNLEVLKVESYHDCTITFPTTQMQSLCPKLRVLCLGYPVTVTNHACVVGFKNLEIFRNPSKLNFLFPRCSVDAVIFESQELKELDISKCVFVKSNCLHPVNYSHLQNLNISSGIVYDIACFIEVIQKWSNSLKVLDASNMTDLSLNDMLQTVILDGGLTNLTTLNLKQTSITIPTMKLIVKNCLQLDVLNLEFCSELEEFSSKYEELIYTQLLYILKQVF
ncbi:unnamed protein product [Larinioides sclopetarius]|uniref:F-box domain-containing protein n=1 Tax=Larinioides sclopetarius TaxID=280406 RepID=A0AAV2B3N2_9ARAC